MVRPIVLVLWLATAVVSCSKIVADDDWVPPPQNPGPGFENIFPAPILPPYYVRDQHTIPHGLQSVANTPVLHLGQSFRPTRSSIDWAAFLFQNTTQPSDPNPPGPGFLQVGLYSGINLTNGTLSGFLGSTDEVAIPNETTQWLVFHFPESIGLVAGNQYYLHVEQTGGYQSWVGIRHQNIYSNGNAFGYYYDTVFNNPPQNLQWGSYDLHFAQGILLPSLPGDINYNGRVDAADYVLWRANGSSPEVYELWRSNLGTTLGNSAAGTASFKATVPEPAPWVSWLLCASCIAAIRPRKRVPGPIR